MRSIGVIWMMWLALTTHAWAFPLTNDIVRCEFYYGHFESSNAMMNIDLGETRQFISMFPPYGNLKWWSAGIRKGPTDRIDPVPLTHHLILTMQDGKQRGISFSYHAGMVSYCGSGLRKVPEELRDRVKSQLDKWFSKWMTLQVRAGRPDPDARVKALLNR